MTVTVHRRSDGTLDVSYTEGPASFSLTGATGSFVDDMQAEKAAPDTPGDASQAPTAPADTQPIPTDAAASAAPVASADPAKVPPYKCPQCGQAYDGPGVCANDHPPAEVVPISAAMATSPDPSSTSASTGGAAPDPAWPDQPATGS